MSVNLSGGQLGQPDLIELIASALYDAGLKPEHLQLEMTESVLMDDAAGNDHHPERSKAWAFAWGWTTSGPDTPRWPTCGASPSMSSRSTARSSAVSGKDLEDSAIVAAVVSLADTLGLTTIAEGVETVCSATAWSVSGCSRAQGYLFARPAPAEAEGAL